MQLGSRWQLGSPPHPGVPELLHEAIRVAEAASAASAPGGSWTLTWLEGRPRVELIDASGTLLADIGVSATGVVSDRVHVRGSAPASAGPNTATNSTDDEDDDDWLI